MSDDIHDRRTPTPEAVHETTSAVPPPWERGTGKTAIPLDQTQPIKPTTVEDVIEIFGHFRQHLLEQIDQRDERILLAIKDIGADIVEYYQRETQRGDEHARRIKELRHRTHKLSHDQQTTNLRLAEIEKRLGIETPSEAPLENPEP